MKKYDYFKKVLSFNILNGYVVFEIETLYKNRANLILYMDDNGILRLMFYRNGNKEPNKIVDFKPIHGKIDAYDRNNKIIVKNGDYCVLINKDPYNISFMHKGEFVLKEQIRDFDADDHFKIYPSGFVLDDNMYCHANFNITSDEHFYGMGEKYMGLDKREKNITCWQRDALSTSTEYAYKNIPFFISTNGYGFLLNSFVRSNFDFGYSSGISLNVTLEEKCMDYYVFLDEDYKKILDKYTLVSGKTPMIPKWAFGLWMSKCSYMSQDEVLSVAEKLRKYKIPCDVIHIDSWMRKASAGDLCWDRKRYPNPELMIKTLHDMGFKLSIWVWPYIMEGCERYYEALEKGYLVKDEFGDVYKFYPTKLSNEKVAAFDFTNGGFREWYSSFIRHLSDMGVDVIKTDFSEALSEKCIFADGSSGIEGHNKYCFLYSQTVYKALNYKNNDKIIWCRSGYAGSQKYPAHWAGDSFSSLNTLSYILKGGLSLGLSGISFWAHDMGGFYNADFENEEASSSKDEYIRSVEFGFLSPLSRCHGKTPREPWNFDDETLDIFKKFDKLRYKLLPYVYSMAYKSSKSGVPIIRPLFLEFPKDLNAYNVENGYFLGDSLLIYPVFDKDNINIYLPDGLWYDFWGGKEIQGGKWIKEEVPLNRIPIYIRCNSIIPMMSSECQFIEDNAFDEVSLLVYAKENTEFEFYDGNEVKHIFAEVNGGIHIKADCKVNDIKFVNGIK